MVKVKCILNTGFNDKEIGKFRKFQEEFEVTEERAKYLESVKAVEIIEVKPEKEVKLEKKSKAKGKTKIDTKN